jgi:hypothetical protein
LIEEGDFVEYNGEYWKVVGILCGINSYRSGYCQIFNSEMHSIPLTVSMVSLKKVPELMLPILIVDERFEYEEDYGYVSSATHFYGA